LQCSLKENDRDSLLMKSFHPASWYLYFVSPQIYLADDDL
jgi:hypothetical protein